MLDPWRLRFFRCLSRLAATFREQLVAELESNERLRHSRALERLREVHERNRRECLSYRLIDQRWLVPLTGMLETIESASGHIVEHGLLRGCRLELERFGYRVETTARSEAEQVLRSEKPVLFVGNHPCIWGPDLWAVAAALDQTYPKRGDFLVLTWTLVMGLCPGLGRYGAPVFVSARNLEAYTHDEDFQHDNRALGFESLFRSWTPDIPVAESRKRTYQALEDMANQWLGGRDIFIFPTGGAGTKALWFSGLGRVVRFAAESLDGAEGADPYIVFFRIQGASDFQLLGPPFLSRWHPARLLGLFFRRRVRVDFCETFRLRDCRRQFLEMSNRSVARFLQEEFDGRPARGSRA